MAQPALSIVAMPVQIRRILELEVLMFKAICAEIAAPLAYSKTATVLVAVMTSQVMAPTIRTNTMKKLVLIHHKDLTLVAQWVFVFVERERTVDHNV